MKFRLLLLCCEGYNAGSTYSIFYQADGLARRGHEVHVGCIKGSLLDQMLSESPAHSYHLPFKSKLDGQSMRRIADLVKDRKIQLINAQSSKDRYLSIFSKWRFRHQAKIFHTRRQTPMSIGGWLQNTFYTKGTEKIIVISHHLKRIFKFHGIKEDHIEVIYNGIPESFYEGFQEEKMLELRKRYGLKEEDTVIGVMARMKKQDHLIQAARHLPASYKLLFAGIEKGSLDKLIKQEAIKQEVIYAGIVPREEVIHHYPLCDLMVLPSVTDGFGLVLVEAMGLGVPVIGTRFAGIIDVIDQEKNGLWYEDDDTKELAKKIQRVLTDPELKSKLIRNGKKAAFGRFSLKNTIDEYERFYSKYAE